MHFILSVVLSLLFWAVPLPATIQVAHADTQATSRTHTESTVSGTITARTVRAHTAPLPTTPVAIPAAVVAPVPAPIAAPKPTPTPPVVVAPVVPASSTSYATQLEQAVFDRVNTQRVTNGLSPLAPDTRLTGIARAYSTNMITNNFFSHTDLNGCGLSCRFNAAGYTYQSIGENIFWMSGYSLSVSDAADMIVQGWMNSPGHRANILNATFTHQGIGIAIVGTKIDATQDLSLPR